MTAADATETRAWRPALAVLPAGTAVALAAAVAAPWILDAYTISVASYALVLALLACSAQLLTGVAGLPTLGQAAYLAIGGYTAAIIGRTVTTNGPAQILAATLAAAVAAAVIGAVVTRARATAFLLISLAVGELTHTAARLATGVTGGDAGLSTPAVVVAPGATPLTRDGHIYLWVLGCSGVIIGSLTVLLRSRFGLILRAAASHEPRVRAAGHPAGRYLWAAYVIAAGVAGAAGALLVAAHRYIAPTDTTFTVSALALLAAVLAGRTLLGACAGALLIVATRDLVVPELVPGHAPALLGVLFLAAAYARPLTDRLRHRRRRCRCRGCVG